MGRHSSPSQGPFYRSIAGWAALWVTIAVITGIAVWLTVTTIGGPEVTPTAATEPRETSEPEPEPTEESTDDPVIVASVSPTPEETRTPELITEGVTVQVLNGTAQPDAAQTMADRLGGLGFTVVTVEESSRTYQETTVFWSSDASREAAEALAVRFGWVAGPQPGNLSTSVSLHVVVGADET